MRWCYTPQKVKRKSISVAGKLTMSGGLVMVVVALTESRAECDTSSQLWGECVCCIAR